LEGLNLNITVQANVTSEQKLLIFVFLHGGGFFIGGNSWPQYDMAEFAQLSVEQNEPIIAINIQ
jgi:carboxylesterase type B